MKSILVVAWTILSLFVFPLVTWVYVARKVAGFYLANDRHKATSWATGLVVGFLAGLALMVLILTLEMPEHADAALVLVGVLLLAAAGFVLAGKRPEDLPEGPRLGDLWEQARASGPVIRARAQASWSTFRDKVRAFWAQAEEDADRKRREKEEAAAGVISLAFFDYVDTDGVWTNRSVTDLGGYQDGTRRYVQGYCIDRQALRTFRLDRIRGRVTVEPGGRKLSPDDFFRALPYPKRKS